MAHTEKDIGNADYVQTYETTCHQHTCIPRIGCVDYDTPCIKTRKLTAYFTLVADFPDDATKEQQAQIIFCAATAATAGYTIAVSTYTVRAPVVGAVLAAAEAANLALGVCRQTFDTCISSLPDDVKNRVGIAVHHRIEENYFVNYSGYCYPYPFFYSPWF